jgi:hypothetical protein
LKRISIILKKLINGSRNKKITEHLCSRNGEAHAVRDTGRSLYSGCDIKMMNPKCIIYNDKDIEVGLFNDDDSADDENIIHLGIRWLEPPAYNSSDGKTILNTNIMGGETGWFLLPHSFGAAVGRKLIEQKAADCGLAEFFNDNAYKRMVAWLVDMDEISGAMEY